MYLKDTIFSSHVPAPENILPRGNWSTEYLRNSRPVNDLKRAEFDSTWLVRTLATFADKPSTEQQLIAKAYRDYLEQNKEPATAAQLYFAAFPNFAHDKFKRSTSGQLNAGKKLVEPGKWGYKLFSRLPEPYLYSLSMKNLGINASYADSRFIYYTAVIEEIKTALKKAIPEPFAWKIEVGKAGNVHTHAIGPFSTALEFLLGSERMKPIKAGTEANTIAYLLKPVAPWTQTNFTTYLQARAENQVSRLSPLAGKYGLGNSRTA